MNREIDMDLADTEVVGEEVHIDGRTFRGVTFRDCTLVYSGGGIPLIEDCAFPGTTIRLSDFAKRSLATLAYLMSPAQVVEYWMNFLHWMDPLPSWAEAYLGARTNGLPSEKEVREFLRSSKGRGEKRTPADFDDPTECLLEDAS